MSLMNLDELKNARAPKTLQEFPISTKELCDRYADVSTPMVNDVLREMNLLHQNLPTAIMPLRDGMKAAGIAFTVKGAKSLVLKDEMLERVEMLAAIPEDSVVVWDTSNDDESAQWGEVMTMAANKQGCRGAVIDGGVRDTDKVLEQGFPIFVKYRTSSGMLGRFRITGYEIPVRIGNVFVNPGDVVLGDIDGVIVVPRDLAYAVLLRAEEIKNAESKMKRWIREGMPAEEVVRRGGYF